MKRVPSLLLLVVSLSLLSTACANGETERRGGGLGNGIANDTGSGGDAGNGGGGGDGSDAPQLTSSHPGWGDPCCLDCHDSSGHRAGLDPYECVACHDKNGSPAGHGGSTPCLACHRNGGDDAPRVHQCASGSYPDPASCQACHGAGGAGGDEGGGDEGGGDEGGGDDD
jgi:hypothetical protein